MSKRRKNKHYHHVNNNHKPKQKTACREIVSLNEWRQFQRFRERASQIESAIKELQDNWNKHVDFLVEEFKEIIDDFTEIEDNITLVSRLVRGVDCKKQYDSSTNYVHNRPNKNYQNMTAEILIEDISDEF